MIERQEILSLASDLSIAPEVVEKDEGRLYYRGPLRMPGSIPRIKLDLTTDELLVLPPVAQPINHPYSDLPTAGMVARCYAFTEVFAEKTRALGERSRPRDLYDVVNLFRGGERRPAASAILQVLSKKCDFKGIAIPSFEALGPAEAALRADWESMLKHQLPALPPFEAYWDALPAFFQWLEMGVLGETLPAAAFAADTELVRPAREGFRLGGFGHAKEIETIRFAAANRLCVDLGYDGSVRRIEPYSLRRSANGDVLLMAVRSDGGESRSYRLDKIQGASVTRQVFTPRYAIELAATDFTIRPTATRPSAASSRSLPPSAGSLPRKARPARGTGPTYVFECGTCGKTFRRSRFEAALNPHQTPGGYPCPGRLGHLVDTRY